MGLIQAAIGALGGTLADPKAVGQASLRQGWNCLLVRNDHLQWQRQFACALLPVEGDTLDDLRYSLMPR